MSNINKFYINDSDIDDIIKKRDKNNKVIKSNKLNIDDIDDFDDFDIDNIIKQREERNKEVKKNNDMHNYIVERKEKFSLTGEKKHKLLVDVINGKSNNVIKKDIKYTDWHNITRSMDTRKNIMKKLNFASDNELIFVYPFYVLNKKLEKFIIDNEIKFKSNGVIFNIESRKDKPKNFISNITGEIHKSIFCIVNAVNHKLLIGSAHNITDAFVSYITKAKDKDKYVYKIIKLRKEIENIEVNKFYVLEIDSFSYNSNAKKNDIEEYYKNYFKSITQGLNMSTESRSQKKIEKKKFDMMRCIENDEVNEIKK